MPSRVGEVARLFTKLGFTAFGGPAAHVAMMEDEVVRRRGWVDRRHFLDLLGAVNFIPGPNSTEMAIHLGFVRAGWAGLVVGGLCFIVPAVLIILPLAWLYVTYAAVEPAPAVRRALAGIAAAVVAIVAAAMWRFAKAAVKDRFTAVVFGASAVAAYLADPATAAWLARRHSAIAGAARAMGAVEIELVILAVAAFAGAIWYARPRVPSVVPVLLPLAVSIEPASPYLRLGLYFLKVGATLFGSGYVLVSYLKAGVVDEHGWMTQRQLLDAIAVGQVTPGPLLTTATFIGYFIGHATFGGGVIGGVIGAVVATVAIFLPAFVFVALLGPVLPRIRRHPLARGALDAMNAAVVGLILVVTLRLGGTAIVDVTSALVAIATLVALLVCNVNATWLVLAGAGVGLMRG